MDRSNKVKRSQPGDIEKYRYRTALFIACSTFAGDSFEAREMVEEFLEEADIVMENIPQELLEQHDCLLSIQDRMVPIGPVQSERAS
ncbi:MAG: hypothetical protein K8F91_11560 [Candidatus Obscuribacterales bacterium]|nr:hypothetical protein [Candidatus Obscuribacterales bacterium]